MRWRSPHSGEMLDENELLKEIALKTVSREYWLINAVQCSMPEIILYSNGIWLVQKEINYKGFTPIPEELINKFEQDFNVWLFTFRGEYGISNPESDVISPSYPTGEKVGRMLRYFSSLRELCMVCSTQKCWDKRNILLFHGLHSEFGEPSELMKKLDESGIFYLIVFNDVLYNENDDQLTERDVANICGCGAFKSITKYEAANIALSLNDGNRDYVASILNLENDYREDSWASNHPEFNG